MTLDPRRKGMVTASSAGAILGLSQYRTADDVLRDMVRAAHGAEPEFTGNAATAWGHANEANAVFQFEMETGLTTSESHYYTFEDWLGATPDREIGKDALLEAKSPYSLRDGGKFKPLSVQPHYYAQIQVQLFCTGREKCAFVQYSPVLPPHIEWSYKNWDWLDENLPKLKAFHGRYLSELDNPAHLEPKRPEITSRTAQQLVDEYQELSDAIDRAAERKKDILAQLVDLSGGKNCKIAGMNLTQVERKGSVKYAEVVKKHLPDLNLAPYTSEKTTYWVLK